MINKDYYRQYKQQFFRIFEKTVTSDTSGELTIEKWLDKILDILWNARANKRNIFFIGNGASCSMASHFATDFTKNGKISAHSLNEGALLTCFANDYSFETVYENIIRYKMVNGDILVPISSSGSSPNIVNGAQFVMDNFADSKILTFTGFDKDNPLRKLGELNLWAPCDNYGVVESIHSYFLQMLVDAFVSYSSEKTRKI